MSASLKKRLERLEAKAKLQCPPEFKVVIHNQELADRYEAEGCDVMHVVFISPDGTMADIKR